MIHHQYVDLFRHGQSLGNLRQDYVDGRNLSVRLSPHGEHESVELGRVYPLNTDRLLVSSTANRAIDTARFAWPGRSFALDSRFVEMSQGEDEGRLRADVHTPEYFAEIKRLGWDHKSPGGESLAQVADRMQEGIADWAEEASGASFTIMSHTTAIRALAGRLKGLSQEDAVLGQKIANTQVSRISNYGKGWVVDFVGLDPAVVAEQDRRNS